MKDEDKSYLWMIQHHTQALITLLEMNKRHEILKPDIAHDLLATWLHRQRQYGRKRYGSR